MLRLEWLLFASKAKDSQRVGALKSVVPVPRRLNIPPALCGQGDVSGRPRTTSSDEKSLEGCYRTLTKDLSIGAKSFHHAIQELGRTVTAILADDHMYTHKVNTPFYPTALRQAERRLEWERDFTAKAVLLKSVIESPTIICLALLASPRLMIEDTSKRIHCTIRYRV